jgi:hypothetical protein
MKLRSAFVLGLWFWSSASFGQVLPWCSQYYHFESYYYGMFAGYTGHEARPTYTDEGCYYRGRQDGTDVAIRWRDNRPACTNAANRGYDLGFQAENQVITEPAECSTMGYRFGISRLSVLARAGDAASVGEECIESYNKGYTDGIEGRIESTPLDKKLSHCYQTGFVEGAH